MVVLQHFCSSFKYPFHQSHVEHAVVSQTKASVHNKLLEFPQSTADAASVDTN